MENCLSDFNYFWLLRSSPLWNFFEMMTKWCLFSNSPPSLSGICMTFFIQWRGIPHLWWYIYFWGRAWTDRAVGQCLDTIIKAMHVKEEEIEKRENIMTCKKEGSLGEEGLMGVKKKLWGPMVADLNWQCTVYLMPWREEQGRSSFWEAVPHTGVARGKKSVEICSHTGFWRVFQFLFCAVR